MSVFVCGCVYTTRHGLCMYVFVYVDVCTTHGVHASMCVWKSHGYVYYEMKEKKGQKHSEISVYVQLYVCIRSPCRAARWGNHPLQQEWRPAHAPTTPRSCST